MSSPSLVGGIALRAYDFPASIAFNVAYGLLIPTIVRRLFNTRSRTAVIFRVLCYAIERIVLFSLRAWAAAGPNTESPGLSEYMQVTFALGYLGLADALLSIIRTILVETTKGTSSSDAESNPVVTELPALVSTSSSRFWKTSVTPANTLNDDPYWRFWYRRWSEFLLVLYLVAMILACVATAHLWNPNDVGWNRATQTLRYISSALGLVLIMLETCTLLWAQKNVPRINQRAVRFLLVLTTVLTIPPIYRLVVMHSTTPDLATPDHQALNTQADKALFYVLHILPEFIVVSTMTLYNVKEICGLEFKGDERWRDETPKEREKREKKELAKAQKKAEAKNASLELKSRNSAPSNDSASTLA
ncbi:hypothetical protein K438DRAFT_1956957 [Mycena galopus ATCC 62051]|nr:hypothetical protein K438DRAFT_1956957 [Mycena galopus ATCC 62051]